MFQFGKDLQFLAFFMAEHGQILLWPMICILFPKGKVPEPNTAATQQLVRAEFAHVDARRAQEFLRELMERWRTEVLELRQSQVRQSYADLKDALGMPQLRYPTYHHGAAKMFGAGEF